MDQRSGDTVFILPKVEPATTKTDGANSHGADTVGATTFTWNKYTGDNITKRPRKKPTEDEKNRMLMMREKGACEDCRKAKRKCTHDRPDSSSADTGLTRGVSANRSQSQSEAPNPNVTTSEEFDNFPFGSYILGSPSDEDDSTMELSSAVYTEPLSLQQLTSPTLHQPFSRDFASFSGSATRPLTRRQHSLGLQSRLKPSAPDFIPKQDINPSLLKLSQPDTSAKGFLDDELPLEISGTATHQNLDPFASPGRPPSLPAYLGPIPISEANAEVLDSSSIGFSSLSSPWMRYTTTATVGHSTPDLAQWTQTTYNAGDRIHTLDNFNRHASPLSSDYSRRGRSSTSTSSRLECESCGKSFARKHDLDRHLRWHGDRPHSCSICKKDFVSAKDLRRHLTTHQKDERRLFCNIPGCKYNHQGFGRKDHLKRHYEKKHPEGLLSPPSTSSLDTG